MTKSLTLDELAKALQAELSGSGQCRIFGVAPLERAEAGQASYLEGPRHVDRLATTRASVVLLSKEFLDQCPTNALIVKKPRLSFAALLHLLYPPLLTDSGLHPTSVIGKDCQIDPTVTLGPRVVVGNGVTLGKNSIIGAGSFIGDNVTIGADCCLYSNVNVYHDVKIGARAIIHSGAVIGADGFGFEPNEKGEWVKVLQVGSVVVGDDVEIGANTTIDRGAITDTVIGNGVKLDNQVMIGHNVSIGDHTIIAACTGIAGSTKIGRHCVFGGACSITGHIQIVDHVTISGAGVVYGPILERGIYSSGTGALPHEQWLRSAVRFRHLDKIYQRLQQLERDSK